MNNMGRTRNNKYEKLLDNYNKEEIAYFNKLLPDTKDNILKIESDLESSLLNITPLRFRFLLSNTTNENKQIIINKINELNKLSTYSSEYSKLHKLVNTISKIPLGIYHNIKIKNNNIDAISNYLTNIKKELDIKIYGHNETKEQIIRILAQYISNPNANGYVIGIQGSMGVGKTKLIKDGVAKVLNYPFAFIPLGGISDSSYLKGHLYTYEGSTYGKIVDEIIKARVMNPIFFFDELDKISASRYGEEITNTLIHITDNTQNDNFTDKYLEEIKLDLSKSIIFFTFNDIDKINPILRDRMIIIKVDKYTKDDKIKLAKNYLIKEICKSYNINYGDNNDDIIINDKDIEYIIDKTIEEEGVRNLQRNINNIYSYINMNRFIKINEELIKYPFTITREIIDKYIIIKREDNSNKLSMYL
jgi:ATP-dependent Lon protease